MHITLFLVYYGAMLDFFKKLFVRKNAAHIPDEMRPELYWEVPLEASASIFPCIDNEHYALTYVDSGIELIAKKNSQFIWQEMPGKIFSDFMIDVDIVLPAKITPERTSMRYAAGLSFRMSDTSTFMFLGISNTSYARLDCLLNGEPLALTGWVECPWLEGDLINIILIARGSHYTVFLNGKFALEAEDDTTREGNLGLSIQTYSSSVPLPVRYSNIIIESRPLEVELAYSRFTNFLANKYTEQRRRLVDSFMSIQAWVSAVIQLKRIEEHGKLTDRDRFNRAECLMREFMYAQAMQELSAISPAYTNYDQVQLEIYNLLYLQGEYLLLKEKLLAQGIFDNPLHCNLLGHAFFNLGDFEQAATWYEKAFLCDPTMPLYAMNAARSAEYAQNSSKAVALWNNAALEFYRQEAYTDTQICIEHLKKLHADAHFILTLEARMAYAQQKFKEAEAILKILDTQGKLDAGSAYLLGMILKPKNAEAALVYLQQARDLEPDNALYQFRYTEALWLMGMPYSEALKQALHHADANGWIYNLAGQIAESQDEQEKAVRYFEKALALLPDEIEPKINLAQALNASGQLEKAITLLQSENDNPALLNALGNLYAEHHNPETALEWYQKALRYTKKTEALYFDILYNQAQVLIELEQCGEAQDTLRMVLEHDPRDVRALIVMGDIWNYSGDYIRAEISWNQALEISESTEIIKRLGMLYITLNKPKKLQKILEKLRRLNVHDIAVYLEQAYDTKIYQTLSCATCGKTWKIPRLLPQVLPPLKLHGEIPDELPAGFCPDCNTLYCVHCAKEYLDDGRFLCPVCKKRLTINKPEILWIYNHWKANTKSS